MSFLTAGTRFQDTSTIALMAADEQESILQQRKALKMRRFTGDPRMPLIFVLFSVLLALLAPYLVRLLDWMLK